MVQFWKGEHTAIKDLIGILIFLLDNIPEAKSLINWALTLSSDNIKTILKVTPYLIRKVLLSKLNYKNDMPREDLEKLKEEVRNNELMLKPAAEWIKFVMIVFNKNKMLINFNDEREIIKSMWTTLSEFEDVSKSNNKWIKDIQKQADFILLILGLSKCQFEYIKPFASQIGLFNEKVEKLFDILLKYKDVIF